MNATEYATKLQIKQIEFANQILTCNWSTALEIS